MEMISNLIGLILTFIGSIGLVFDGLYNLGKPKPTYFPPNKKMGWEVEKLEPQKDGFLKKVKYTKEEIKLVIFLSLLILGLLLQIKALF